MPQSLAVIIFLFFVSLNKPLACGNGFVSSFKMRNTGIWLFYDGGFDMHRSVASLSPEIVFSNKFYIVMSFLRQVTQKL